MWDTWVFQDEDEYHLFFLIPSEGAVGRAVSTDLIHWKPLPPIKNLARKGEWDESGMICTGCTVKHEGKYYMSYGSGEGTPISSLVSTVLTNWQGTAQGTKHVRILTREHMTDVYVDWQWIFSADMKDLPAKGKLGFFVESGKATISNLHVAELEPLTLSDTDPSKN